MVDIVKHSTSPVQEEKEEESDDLKPVNIVPALAKAFGLQFFIAILLKVVQDLLKFVSPQILKLLIKYVQKEKALDESAASGGTYDTKKSSLIIVNLKFSYPYAFYKLFQTI